MRSSKSRSRNKSNRQRSLGNVMNRVFDSSGPEGKVRGTPQQIIDKYLTLARDAQLSGDRVAEQSFLQHAEHYTRLLGEAQREQAERQAQHQQNQQNNGRQNGQNGQNGQTGQTATGGDEDRGADVGGRGAASANKAGDSAEALPDAKGEAVQDGPIATPEDQPAPARKPRATRAPSTRSRRKATPAPAAAAVAPEANAEPAPRPAEGSEG